MNPYSAADNNSIQHKRGTQSQLINIVRGTSSSVGATTGLKTTSDK